MHAENYVDYPILIEEDLDAPVPFVESPARQKSPARRKSPALRKSPRKVKKITTLDRAGRLRYGNQPDLEALRSKIRSEWEKV